MPRTKTASQRSAGILIKRFEGSEGRRLLLEALREQKMVSGNANLANDIANVGELIPVAAGTTVVEQGGIDNHVFLILAGSFNVVVNGKIATRRHPADHVGEMAAVQPTQPRSATVTAVEDSVLLKISEPQLAALGTKYSEIYRYLAKELSKRLLQRNSQLMAKRDKIHIFIMSSAEALGIARAVQSGLDDGSLQVSVWTDGVFRASQYAIENLERELDRSDFAIAVVQPDDATKSKGKHKPSARENVIFELGFFIGRLGRHRALLLEPRGEEVKLPSDLTGLTTIPYRIPPGKDWAAALGPACNRIREIISDLGLNN
jgi:CRP/FNR family transcriptional regulator, cyclic AMP receptor protein